jgi:sulfur-oxidizing protein SoxB
MALTRRDFIKVLGAGSTAGLIGGCGNDADKLATQENKYEVAKTGNARILHITDTHGNLLPNYFREPNVNLGFGSTFGQLPHVVGNKLLKQIGVKPGSPEAYASLPQPPIKPAVEPAPKTFIKSLRVKAIRLPQLLNKNKIILLCPDSECKTITKL